MNTLKLFAILLISGTFASADVKYLVQSMICKGTITSLLGNQVHPSYSQIGIKLTSFKSMRRDGVLVDSLEWLNTYAGPAEKLDLSFNGYSEQWFMAPLYMNSNKEVYKEDLRLKIVSSQPAYGTNVIRKDFLVGTYGRPNSVAGSYGYKLTCEATVVSQPQKILDFTAKHNR